MTITYKGAGERVTLVPYPTSAGGVYPVNEMRNAALCAVKTSHAVYTDMDLWPSQTLYAKLEASKQKVKDSHHPRRPPSA